jgi:hypothetical protein
MHDEENQRQEQDQMDKPTGDVNDESENPESDEDETDDSEHKRGVVNFASRLCRWPRVSDAEKDSLGIEPADRNSTDAS